MFQPGHPKFGGRKKGSGNLLTKAEALGIDVFEELLTLANAEQIPDKRFNKFKIIAEFLYARPKDEFDISKLTPEQIREYVMGIANESKPGA